MIFSEGCWRISVEHSQSGVAQAIFAVNVAGIESRRPSPPPWPRPIRGYLGGSSRSISACTLRVAISGPYVPRHRR